MNVFNSTNEISGYFIKIGGITMFYASPCDARKSMIVGHNVLCVLADLGQWCENNVCDLNMHESKVLNAASNEYAPKEQNESNESNEAIEKKVEDWIQPTKFMPINYFFKKHKNKVECKENENKFDGFVHDVGVGDK